MNKQHLSNLLTLLRRSIYIGLGRFDALTKRKNNFVIYCYHSIDNDGWKFSVTPNEFKKQIESLLKGNTPANLKDVISYFEYGVTEKPKFLITFDDGYKNLLRIADYLKEQGITPTLFVISDRENVDRKSIDNKKALLSNQNLRTLSKLGWNIESHGNTHLTLTTLENNKIKDELVNSKKDLETVLNTKVKAISYPHGKYSKEILKEAEAAEYQIGFSTDDALFQKNSNIYAIPRVGVDGSHSFEEFKYIASPSVIGFRKLVKSTFLSRYL